METIKKGSKGEAVKTLQKALGLTADGIFGSGTESKVKEFLKAHNLTADGIVGTSTWAVLGIKSEPALKCVDESVIYDPLKVHITACPNRPIKYLAIHYTAGASSKAGKAQGSKHIFETRAASADFLVDDATMVLFNPDLKNYYCWAVGDKFNKWTGGGSLNGKATNKNTISIEICSNLTKGTSASQANHEGWYYTDEALNNAIKLSKILMKKFNIDIDHVVRHYDITGKLCPGIKGWNNGTLNDVNGNSTKEKNTSEKWEEFKKRLIS